MKRIPPPPKRPPREKEPPRRTASYLAFAGGLLFVSGILEAIFAQSVLLLTIFIAYLLVVSLVGHVLGMWN